MSEFKIPGDGKSHADLNIVFFGPPASAEDIQESLVLVKQAREFGSLMNVLIGKVNAKYAIYYTRQDDKILPDKTRNKYVGRCNFYKNGLRAFRNKDGTTWTLNSYTVENESHVLNFDCTVDDQGFLVGTQGVINIFTGTIPIDQIYLDCYLEEFLKKIESKGYFWDKVCL